MKTIALYTANNTDKVLKGLLLNDLKAFKTGKGKFLRNNQNRLRTTLQIA